MARLDKADILELTVSQLTSLQNHQRSVSLATDVDGYKRGFKDCARETIRYLTATQSLDTDSLFRVNNHLQSCYLEKTRGIPNVPQPPTDVSSVHASTVPRDIQQTGDHNSSFQHQQSFYRPVQQARVAQHVPCANGQIYSDYQFYHPCNDSVDTSLNSSGNMSIDSSSSVTPEKVVPCESTEEDVWRPW